MLRSASLGLTMLSLSSIASALALTACGSDVSDADTGTTSGSSSASGSGGGSSSATGSSSSGSGGATGASTGASGSSSSGGDGGAGGSGPQTAKSCFKDIQDGVVFVNYDQYNPVINSTCSGTNHQDIQGVERVVYLGDSITTGTPPTPNDKFYANVLTAKLKAKFGDVPVQNCSAWGAQTDDFLANGNQIEKCFPTGVEEKKTLVVMTMGGNDIASWAKKHLDAGEALMNASKTLQNMRDAVTWLKDPVHFPNGSYVMFANVYEFTDLTTDLGSCPTAGLAGFSGMWLDGAAVVTTMEEEYMKIAVDTKTDMIFLEETFCGHGFHANDPAGQCYRGPNTPTWFDVTCIHPTPDGHAVIAGLFGDTVDE